MASSDSVNGSGKIGAVAPNQSPNKPVGTRFSPALRAKLEAEAKERGMHMSDVIREAYEEHVERREGGDHE